jgi:hypothetical protein
MLASVAMTKIVAKTAVAVTTTKAKAKGTGAR